jgi:hypothetical protein
MTKILIDKIRLSAGHSLVSHYIPEVLDEQKVSQKLSKDTKDIQSFGLFDSATPNFQTYYPEVTAEDLKPKKEDFIEPAFRLLSEVIVRKKFDPIDFSMNGVLKASMNKLVGQAVYPNHEPLVGNELGVVKRVLWQDAYTTNDGIDVPAGINGIFLIDGKSHPNIARGIMMDPPSIHSNSVTVEFAWERSHPSMSDEEFWSKTGTFAKDGQLVRRVVTEVINFSETSLVPHGADPFAQKIGKNGQIVNPDYASRRDSLSEYKKEPRKNHFFIDYKEVASLSEKFEDENQTIPNNSNNKTEDFMKDKVILAALTLLGMINIKLEELTEEQATDIEAKLTALKTSSTELATLKTEKQGLETQVQTLTSEKTKVEGELAAAKTTIQGLEEIKTAELNEVKRLYAALGEKDDTILKSFEGMDVKTLSSFKAKYQKELDEKVPHVCQDCNSTNVARNSASPEEGNAGEGNKGEKNPKVNTPQEFAEFMKNRKVNTSRLHGEE